MRRFIGTLLLLMLLAGCGPSAEEQAAMTAAAWTPTPPPTPTSTPVPYGLTLTVKDKEGNPLPWAELTLQGAKEPQPLNAEAQLVLEDLPAASFSANVTAQGYKSQGTSALLERGPNEVTVELERDPSAMLPTEACGPGETPAYIEDFQDGTAQNWPEIDFRANGWNLGPAPDDPANVVASYDGPDHPYSTLQNENFTDAVWRLRLRIDGSRLVSLNWLQQNNVELDGQHVDDSRYQIVIDPRGTQIRRLTIPVMNIGVASGKGAKVGAWHNVEISTFQGHTEVWLDGVLSAKYTDPKPLPAGTIALELLDQGGSSGTVVSFDNIAVCNLTAPFVSLYAVK